MGEKNKNTTDKNGGAKNSVTVVLKADLHCEGCVTKVLKCIRSLNGVNSASIVGEQKITVVGKVDPVKLRNKVEQKTHKKIELLSPQPRKDNNNINNKENTKDKENSGSSNTKQKKESNDKNSRNKSDQKKSIENEKQLLVTTAVLKVHLHCEGCIQKISKVVSKTKGYHEMKVDKEKNLVTVTGAMDMVALAQMLKKHLKKDVEILPQKKDVTEKKEKSGGEKQKIVEKEKGKNGEAATADEGKMEANKVQSSSQAVYSNPNPNLNLYPNSYVYEEQVYYNPYTYGAYHAPQLFSDENPNACIVM